VGSSHATSGRTAGKVEENLDVQAVSLGEATFDWEVLLGD
jgi:hypothetical protein